MMPRLTSWLKSWTLPEVLGRAAVMILKEVDFPAPLGPRSPKIYSSPTEKLLFEIANLPFPYILVR